MTVTYIQHVHTAGKLGTFTGLFKLWKGGVLKGIWRNLLVYCFLYALISLTYRCVLVHSESAKLNFERLCVQCGKGTGFIPLSFILGFYVTQVVERWWLQYNTLPWPDKVAMNLALYLPGSGKPKQIRRLVVRLANLSSILVFRRISPSIARRFPTYDHFVAAGLMTESEQKQLDYMHEVTENLHQILWLPIQWAQAAIGQAMDEGMIESKYYLSILQKNLDDLYYDKISGLISYAWINIPLVYTQLVSLGVHFFFLVQLLAMQFLHPTTYIIEDGKYVPVPPETPDAVNLVGYDEEECDYYVPVFTIMQFVFFFGWLKVAETLINPFGDDDDDFDLNYVVDRNFQLSYLMVEMDKEKYEMESDTYGGKIPPATLPHTVISIEEKYSDPPRLTERIIMDAEEEIRHDEGKPLFHIPETPQFNLSRATSQVSLNGMGTFDVLNSVLSVTQNMTSNETLEGNVEHMDDIEEDEEGSLVLV